MKNVVFWDINTRSYFTGDTLRPATESRRLMLCKIEVFTTVTMKNVVFWDINTRSYFTGDTLRLRYRVQAVNAM
jgi:hypothetical protein